MWECMPQQTYVFGSLLTLLDREHQWVGDWIGLNQRDLHIRGMLGPLSLPLPLSRLWD